MRNTREVKSPEEREKELEKTLERVRPQIVKGKGPVQTRVNAQASKSTEGSEGEEKKKKKKNKENNKGKKNLGELAKDVQGFERKTEKAKKKGVSLTPNVKGDTPNDKNKEKSKEMASEKQEQNKTEMLSRVKLPSGLELRQEGKDWNLVTTDPTGRETRTPVTDVINTIEQYNRDVDVANSANRMQNNVQSGVDKAADTARKDNMDDNLTKTQAIETALPLVKDVAGNQVFKPEDIKLVAETALQYCDEKAVLAELRDRDNKNQHNADEKKQQRELSPQVRASIGRGGMDMS